MLRDDVRDGKALNEGNVRRVDELFGQAAQGLQEMIDAAERRAVV